MADDVKVVRPDAPRDVVSHQGSAVITSKITTATFVYPHSSSPVAEDSRCGGEGRTKHCWHSSGRTLTSYPGYSVEHCCFCGATHHRPLEVPKVGRGHGPYAR